MTLVKLYAGDAMIVHHLRGLLEQEGVNATVMGDSLGAARGDIPVTVETMPAVWIEQADVERARPILERFMRAGREQDTPVPELPPWRCPRCDERIESQFTSCWNCGEARPDPPPTDQAI